MDTETVTNFFAILALIALVGGVVVLVLWVVWLAAPASRERLAPLRSDVGRVAVPLAFLVAAGATLGSLYYSEIADFAPCRYCWYQRIAMYPLALILLIAALRRDRDIWIYVLPISVIGLAISIYHYQLQQFPSQDDGSCAATGPACTVKYIDQFDFITIPFMAGCGFIAICALMLLARTQRPSVSGVANFSDDERIQDGHEPSEFEEIT